MSIRRSTESGIAERTLQAQPPWVRPSEWLALTPPGPTEQKFVGLVAVFDQGSNYIALRATYALWSNGTCLQSPRSLRHDRSCSLSHLCVFVYVSSHGHYTSKLTKRATDHTP